MIRPKKRGFNRISLKSRWKVHPNVRFALEAIEIFLVVFVLSWFMKTYLIDFAATRDQSMLPTLNTGNHVVVEKYFNRDIASLESGNIIVFEKNNIINVKRIVGFPGDKVEIKSGYTFVNGKPIYEPYANTPSTFTFLPVIVPDNCVFVLNDDRTDPLDSRFYGGIPEENIIGRALMCFWPLSNIKTL